ncbi:hypothetical protein ABNF97_03460 [Plantactinospora sp. B6F1]|uniref:hypothetical protein n=1 Tax=Plantactinospora sp. B6F1 TaxID=3158971 RepID=UPI0032D8C8CC
MAESAPHRMVAESSGRHRRVGPVVRPDRAGRRLRLISTVGLGAGLLLLAIPFGAETLRTTVWGGGTEPRGGIPAAVASPPAPESTPAAGPTPADAPPTGPAAPTPTATSTANPTSTPRATGAPAPTPPVPSRPPLADAAAPTPPATTGPQPPATTSPPPPQPVLLGPNGRDELARMMDRYCDAHVGGLSWADTRDDGGWECGRLLLPARTVDIDRACRDSYGDAAFAENRAGRDPFGWRCFRH